MLPLRAKALSLLGLGLLACSKPVTAEECQALLDRYVEKLVGSDRPGTSASEVFRLKIETRKKAQEDPAFRNCQSEVSRRQMDCALEAETLDRMEICLY